MRITVHSWCAPKCKCGQSAEIYLDAYNRRLRVKCHYCGREQSASIDGEVYSLSLRDIMDMAICLA